MWDLDGNEYIEFNNGLRSTTLGHGFEPVVRAARRRMADGRQLRPPAPDSNAKPPSASLTLFRAQKWSSSV